tara:strand:- start:700 stop:891 length:192 start_codon:yes stop_codon:yes gene_type:complete
MKYLEMYCKEFNLKMKNHLILDSSDEVVGHIEPNKKYVKFNSCGNPMKESDLLMLVLENLSVH